MAWTNEQQQAITLRNSSLIVSAAAGSGKTSVLVERLIQILSDTTEKVFADRMIVVTFTNDAAAEMKQRLQTAFEKRIAEEPENRWLRQQQLLLPAAKISTINAFCFDLIREHLGDGEITSSFRVMDETEQDLLFRAAVDEVLNRWYTERAAEMQLLWNAFCNHTDQALEELLLELKTFLASIPFPEQWKQQVLQRFSVPDAENPDYLEFLKLMQERAAVLTDEVERLYVLSEDLYEEKNNVAEWMSVDFDTMHALLHALQQQPADAEQILGLQDVSLTYSGYEVDEFYPKNGNEIYFVMNATPGNNLLVVKFTLRNLLNEEQDIQIQPGTVRVKIIMNGEEENALTTMLLNDLATYQGTLGPNEETELVVVGEYPVEDLQSIDSLSVKLKNESCEVVLNCD